MNDMRSSTIGTLLLRPTGNSQGGYYFYSLMMGHVIARQRYTLLPMPRVVIDHVHHKTLQENASTGLFILNCWREEMLRDTTEGLNKQNDNPAQRKIRRGP